MIKSKRVMVFLEFLIGGIFFGIIEDIIVIKILTNKPITLSILGIIFIVSLPFAFLGEYLIDRIDFIKILKLDKKYKKAEIFLEFLIIGVLLGVVEDLMAFYFVIGEAITKEIIFVAFLVVIPFAFVGEILLDRINIQKTIVSKRIIMKNNKKYLDKTPR